MKINTIFNTNCSTQFTTKKLLLFCSFLFLLNTQAQQVSTLAGSISGFNDGTAAAAQFDLARGLVLDAVGNIYVADTFNNKIRKISTTGAVTTLAGSTQGFNDATGVEAQFYYPMDIAVDPMGNLYVADSGNNKIRKITTDGVVTTLAGSTFGYEDANTGIAAKFLGPSAIAIDAMGNLYVADTFNNKIRKVSTSGVVNTVAGSAQGFADANTGAAAQFNNPLGIEVDATGNIYVGDTNNHKIRKISPTGTVTTLAGGSTSGFADATGTAALFFNPNNLVIDGLGNLYIADRNNHKIRKVTPDGVVSTFAGSSPGYSDADALTSQFYFPRGVASDASGNVYVSDTFNFKIRKIGAVLETNTFDKNGIILYPNPAENFINIYSEEKLFIEINSITGQLVHSITADLGTNQINIAKLTTGIYLLKAINEKGLTKTTKIVKE